MRKFLFYVGQGLLIIGYYNYSYLPTLTLDFFPWGASGRDSLYLLVVVYIYFPLILIVSLVKCFVTRRLRIEEFYKWTFLISIVIVLMCTFLLLMDITWVVVILSTIMAIGTIAETIVARKQLLTNDPTLERND